MNNNRLVRYALLVIVTCLGIMPAKSVPASPELLTMTQPDGTIIQVRLYGDERGHYYTTPQGEPLLESDGAFRYAILDARGALQPGDLYTGASASRQRMSNAEMQSVIDVMRSNIQASEPRHPYTAARYRNAVSAAPRYDSNNGMNEPPTPLPGLFPGSDFPTIGSPRVLVILVEFSDVSFSSSSAADIIRAQITQPNYTERNFTGSAFDYYRDASCGQFTPQFDVLGPVKVPGTQAFYGGNSSSAGGSDLRPREMVIDACTILAATVDMSVYDNNHDGYIDNVYVIYAGRGEASGGGPNTIWPHSWSIPEDMSPVYNGVKLSSYACGNELALVNGNLDLDAIGTFCHEFGHVLGLPDLYSTGYNCDNHPGAWALMASGSYVNGSRTPPTLSSWERAALGWLKPKVLTTGGSYTLKNSLLTTNEAYLIPTGHSNEYFILENRQFGLDNWDHFVPSWGMLVWHIDYNERIWSYNIVNDNASHQYANIVEAYGDDLKPVIRLEDCFPTNGHNAFTENTVPALKAWDGSLTDITLPSITEDDETYDVFFTTNSRSGVEAISAEEGIIFRIVDLKLIADGGNLKRLDLYTIDGRLIDSSTARNGVVAPAPGIYIARCGSACVKVKF